MKHTLKKLLCMALAIMLLISVVPVFACAMDGEFEEGAGAPENNALFEQAQVEPEQQAEEQFVTGTAGGNAPTVLSELTGNDGSAMVQAVLITYDEATKTLTRTRTCNASFASAATYNDVLTSERGLNQNARTNGIAEVEKFNYTVRKASSLDDMNAITQANYAAAADSLTTPVGGDADIFLQFFRVRKVVDVTLELDGSTSGPYTMKDVPLYSTLNLPSAFSTAKLKPNTGYYIASYRDNGRVISSNNVTNYLITAAATITGYQDLLVNKPINDGNVNTSGGGNGTVNGGNGSLNLGNGTVSGGNGTTNSGANRFPYDVVLHIYQNNKVDAPVKNIVINDTLAADGVVSLSEVKNETLKYFNAKTSAGIGYAGLYYARGNWVADYATYNGEYDSITGIDSMRQTSQVDINVMITNANAKSTSKADSSNPKTGDTIFVPVMVMGLTATTLAAAYVFGKKRFAR